ncbi:hypothetical protein [Candidatus Electronema sp. JC]|uniref:hypothetical protein n=1 Tax=Candidatus Electronema sp. JC TaxID=3401570 RepID=UPI003AA8EB9E
MKKVLSLFAAALFTVAASNAVFAEEITEETAPAVDDAAAVTEAEEKDVEKAEKAEEKDVEKAEKAEEKDVVEEETKE